MSELHLRASDARFERASNDFKPDAAAIEEAPVPVSAHAALYVVLFMLFAAIIWSVVGMVDRIVVAPGRVATRTPIQVMQPFSTSRVLAILVKPGDHVRKGQVLVTFDPAFAQADVASLQQKVASLSAQSERLEAELENRPFPAGPGDDPARITQLQIFGQETSDYTAELAQRESHLAAIDAQIHVDDQNIPGARAQLDMANQVVAMQERLKRQQAAATLDVLRANSAAIDATLRLQSMVGDQEKLMRERDETTHERQAFIDKWRSDHNQQLVQARQDLAESSETLNKAHRLRDFTEITAPVDGTVQDVAERSAGSVLREAETLVTLVPDNADLYIEANVPSRDIGYLKLGDAVRVKLESYPFQRFGTVNGVLDVINPDSSPLGQDDEAHRVYRIQVRLADNLNALASRGIHLKPGLVASAEVKTGRHTIASYILNPVLRIADESLREP